MTLPRGIRNNNPLNIRRGDQWQELAATQSLDYFAMLHGWQLCWQ